MTVEGLNFEASGNRASTRFPGEPETREDHNNMVPNGWARRRLLLAGGATVLLAGVGAAGYLLWPDDGQEPDVLPDRTKDAERKIPRGDFNEVPRVFYGPDGQPLEKRREEITLPETLDPPTFAEAFANVGQAIEYYVNNGDLAGLQTVVPGTTNYDAMQPGQLYMRAAFIARFREVYGDAFSENHYRDNPENMARHYAWGLQIKLLEQLDQKGADIADTEMVSGKVRVAIGDYRPEIDGHYRRWQIEKPREYEGTMTITRYANLGTNARLPNNGWGVYQMSFPKLPQSILDSPPQGYETTPPLYHGRPA